MAPAYSNGVPHPGLFTGFLAAQFQHLVLGSVNFLLKVQDLIVLCHCGLVSYGCLWFSLLVDILATVELHSTGFSLYRVGVCVHMALCDRVLSCSDQIV